MNKYYKGRHARNYNRQWRTFTERTLAEVLPILEKVVLLRQREHRLRILDVACGTGILLKRLAVRFPDADLFGVDASRDMLNQACITLSDLSHVHVEQAEVGPGERANLPFAPASFDIITCTNTLHYFSDPEATLRGLQHLLVPTGHLVMEDYVLRDSPFPCNAFEWVIKLYDPQHIRLYTHAEAEALCRHVDLHTRKAQTFPIDLFCQGWILLLERTDSRNEVAFNE